LCAVGVVLLNVQLLYFPAILLRSCAQTTGSGVHTLADGQQAYCTDGWRVGRLMDRTPRSPTLNHHYSKIFNFFKHLN